MKRIASHAFWHSSVITGITLPASVTWIDSHVFENCPDLTIHAPKGSYAEQHAYENGIPFGEI